MKACVSPNYPCKDEPNIRDEPCRISDLDTDSHQVAEISPSVGIASGLITSSEQKLGTNMSPRCALIYPKVVNQVPPSDVDMTEKSASHFASSYATDQSDVSSVKEVEKEGLISTSIKDNQKESKDSTGTQMRLDCQENIVFDPADFQDTNYIKNDCEEGEKEEHQDHENEDEERISVHSLLDDDTTSNGTMPMTGQLFREDGRFLDLSMPIVSPVSDPDRDLVNPDIGGNDVEQTEFEPSSEEIKEGRLTNKSMIVNDLTIEIEDEDDNERGDEKSEADGGNEDEEENGNFMASIGPRGESSRRARVRYARAYSLRGRHAHSVEACGDEHGAMTVNLSRSKCESTAERDSDDVIFRNRFNIQFHEGRRNRVPCDGGGSGNGTYQLGMSQISNESDDMIPHDTGQIQAPEYQQMSRNRRNRARGGNLCRFFETNRSRVVISQSHGSDVRTDSGRSSSDESAGEELEIGGEDEEEEGGDDVGVNCDDDDATLEEGMTKGNDGIEEDQDQEDNEKDDEDREESDLSDADEDKGAGRLSKTGRSKSSVQPARYRRSQLKAASPTDSVYGRRRRQIQSFKEQVSDVYRIVTPFEV
ncbi:unnamed protein product [Protopolystoma xenopodis]|uniref:Uncharacterized protein n=1 Tax=Protopolystoma xenopodis TaxID=117903 RepID=A0A448WM12_9PLAT|nr:unnamed protein product [Protopolystoma xenopodis]